MRKPKALDIFIVAEQFRCAGKLAHLIPDLAHQNPAFAFAADLPEMPSASMVCMAFSLELYFKCLIRMGRKSVGKGHDLAKLFALIGRRERAKIKRYFRSNSANVRSYVERMYQESGRPIPTVDFDFVPSASKDAFAQIRYIYERGIESDTGWLGDTIVEGARQTILEKHPGWERARQTSPLPETSFRSTFPAR